MIGVLDDVDVEKLLSTHILGRLGCHQDGRTYVVPITYAYADGCAYAHSAEGLKLRMMRAEPRVCFEVEEVLDLTCWKSVIAQGTFEELHGEEAERARTLLLDAYRRAVDSPTARPHLPAGVEPTVEPVLYRIRLESPTGRCELA